MTKMPRYNPDEVELKWQAHWEDTGAFCASDDHTKPKFYPLIEFPYPSGHGLHVGHPRSNTAMDVIARKRRMEGCNVLFPIGYDAFGLPTENYAIKNRIHPAVVTRENIAHFRAQLKRLGFSFDYSREVDTTDPAYYKWTQWIFLKLFEAGAGLQERNADQLVRQLQVRAGQTRRSWAASASGAAARSCARSRASGCCASPPTRKSCWTALTTWTSSRR